MAIYNSMNLHHIIEVKVNDLEAVMDDGKKIPFRNYVFIDRDGNEFTVSALMEKEE